MLRGMLEINPYYRWSVQECLKSPLFDDIRVPKLESIAPKKISLMVDSEDAFDYEEGLTTKFQR